MGYKDDLTNILNKLNELNEESRLWIFQSDKELDEQTIAKIESRLSSFLPNWTSHNRQLIAKSLVAFNHFIIIALDQTQSSSASGCSIDAMTHQIQDLSQQLHLNLLDRSTFYFVKGHGIFGIGMHELKDAVTQNEVNLETPVFNNLIKHKGELGTKWIIPLGESWHKRFA